MRHLSIVFIAALAACGGKLPGKPGMPSGVPVHADQWQWSVGSYPASLRGEARRWHRLGLRHGAYCVGCCWALMMLLFVGGVMNLPWMLLLALLVLLEKVTSFGRQIAALAGVVFVAAGAWLLLTGT